MADRSVQSEDLASPIDLPSGQSHTLTVDSELRLFVAVPDDAGRLELVIRDESGQEVARAAAASLPSEGSYRAFDLRSLPGKGPYQAALYDGERLVPPAMKLELEVAEQSVMSNESSGPPGVSPMAPPDKSASEAAAPTDDGDGDAAADGAPDPGEDGDAADTDGPASEEEWIRHHDENQL